MNTGIMVCAQIDGAFYGFNRDVLFKLTDGTFWLQDEYRYWYHYAYQPQVEILRDGGRLSLRLAGGQEMVLVRQLSGVIESRISGAFEGWQGKSEYRLTNGMVWKQQHYKYEYKYSYQPAVMIYDTPSGKIMDVDGCQATVQRVR